MFAKALETLYEKHFERIAQVYDDPKSAFDLLAEHNLDVLSINKACCIELKEVLVKTHDFQVSDRLNKYGWTTKHISDHMMRFFESKMKAAARLLTLVLKDGPDADFQKALRLHEPKNVDSEHNSDSDEDARYAVIGRHNRDFMTNIENEMSF